MQSARRKANHGDARSVAAPAAGLCFEMSLEMRLELRFEPCFEPCFELRFDVCWVCRWGILPIIDYSDGTTWTVGRGASHACKRQNLHPRTSRLCHAGTGHAPPPNNCKLQALPAEREPYKPMSAFEAQVWHGLGVLPCFTEL